MAALDRDPVGWPLPSDKDLGPCLAAAADLCLKPWRHAVVIPGPEGPNPEEICVRLEARNPQGVREPEHDLDLEIYRSGTDLNVMLSWCQPADRPLLWHGRHPVWMDGASGERCERPVEGVPLEALARRLRALLLD